MQYCEKTLYAMNRMYIDCSRQIRASIYLVNIAIKHYPGFYKMDCIFSSFMHPFVLLCLY